MKTILHFFIIGLFAFCSLSAPSLQAQQIGIPEDGGQQTMSIADGKKAIEQFMGVTAMWLIEMEWTFGHDNKTPTANDRRKVMLAADLSKCPPDFQQAWLKQVRNPERNFSAPIFRKYGVDLAALRKELQKELKDIDPSISPPVPLYNDDENPPKYDPTRSGKQENILAAVTKLRAKLNGIDPGKALEWQKAIYNVMLEFTICYMETIVSMNAGGIPRDEVETMFKKINVEKCPPDFVKAWQHDLEYFVQGQFDGAEFQLAPVCKRYGVDETKMLEYVKRKMNEWGLRMPNKSNILEFRVNFKGLKANLLDHR